MIPYNLPRALPVIFLAIISFFINPFGVIAQVQIAPTALYLSDTQTSGRMIVRNSSSAPVELSIELLYAFPDTDQKGNVYLKIINSDSIAANAPSAIDWIRVYPRHLTLPPRQQQLIRFLAHPPAGLPAGEYWARPAISSQKKVSYNDSVNGHISTSFNITKRNILSINYRHGQVSTGIKIKNATARLKNGRLQVTATLIPSGNAAYLGTVYIRVLNNAGSNVAAKKREIAVYHDQKRSFVLGKNLPNEPYKVQITLSTKARAAANENIIKAPSVTKIVTIVQK